MPIQKITSGIIQDGAVSAADIVSVSNTAITGTITGSQISSNTLSNTVFQTGSVENYMNAQGLGFGMRNRIINGAMQIAQRANSATITAAATIANSYSTVDRFYVYSTGANVTAAQVAGSGATKNRLQITGNTSVTAVGIGQRIESNNSYDLANSTATLSADLAISATLTTVTWTASYANTSDTFGTSSSNTNTQIATGTFTVTSAVTNFSTNITIPAAATTGIQILFTVGALTSGLTWTIGNVQLEKGSTATSFDYRPHGTELALCQRYLPCYNFTVGNQGTYTGLAYGSATATINFVFPVQTRVAPTGVTVTGTFNAATATYGNSGNFSSLALFTASIYSAGLNCTGGSGFTAGNATQLLSPSGNSQIQFTGCEL